jgi:hypothetical protein
MVGRLARGKINKRESITLISVLEYEWKSTFPGCGNSATSRSFSERMVEDLFSPPIDPEPGSRFAAHLVEQAYNCRRLEPVVLQRDATL